MNPSRRRLDEDLTLDARLLPEPVSEGRVCFTQQLYRGGIKRCVLTHIHYARKTKTGGRARPLERIVFREISDQVRHKHFKYSILT